MCPVLSNVLLRKQVCDQLLLDNDSANNGRVLEIGAIVKQYFLHGLSEVTMKNGVFYAVHSEKL